MTIVQSRITLKKLQVASFASEETVCFTAIVVFDGQAIATARNQGHGGATDFRALKGQEHRLNEAEAYAKTLPPVQTQISKDQTTDLPVDLELLIDILVDDLRLLRDFNRDFNNKAMFIIQGTLRYLRGVKLRTVTDRAALFQRIRTQHGAEIVLNELPREKAFVLWRRYATVR